MTWLEKEGRLGFRNTDRKLSEETSTNETSTNVYPVVDNYDMFTQAYLDSKPLTVVFAHPQQNLSPTPTCLGRESASDIVVILDGAAEGRIVRPGRLLPVRVISHQIWNTRPCHPSTAGSSSLRFLETDRRKLPLPGVGAFVVKLLLTYSRRDYENQPCEVTQIVL